eukprot:COSAG01_NODE_873_length_12981_cov_34.559929_6_plen_254_part_00
MVLRVVSFEGRQPLTPSRHLAFAEDVPADGGRATCSDGAQMSQVAVDRAACVQRPSLSDAAGGGGGGRREREEVGARSLLPALPPPPRRAQASPAWTPLLQQEGPLLDLARSSTVYGPWPTWHGMRPMAWPAAIQQASIIIPRTHVQTLELCCERFRQQKGVILPIIRAQAVQRPLDGRATHRPVGVVRPRLAVSRRYRGRDAPGERLCRGRVRLFLGWGSVQRSSRREVLPPCQRPPPRCVFPLPTRPLVHL